MTLNEYQVAAQRTSNTKNQAEKIDNALLGLSGEVGELCDAMKKHLFQGHQFDHNQMVREAGDVLWYIAELACGLGVTLDEIACCNIEKLRARYPDGFNREKSMHRMDGDI